MSAAISWAREADDAAVRGDHALAAVMGARSAWWFDIALKAALDAEIKRGTHAGVRNDQEAGHGG